MNTYQGTGPTPTGDAVPTASINWKKYLVVIILTASIIHVCYSLLELTPEEIIETQIEMNGQQWQELQDEKELYIKQIDIIETKQSLLHEQNQGMRAFQLSENL